MGTGHPGRQDTPTISAATAGGMSPMTAWYTAGVGLGVGVGLGLVARWPVAVGRGFGAGPVHPANTKSAAAMTIQRFTSSGCALFLANSQVRHVFYARGADLV